MACGPWKRARALSGRGVNVSPRWALWLAMGTLAGCATVPAEVPRIDVPQSWSSAPDAVAAPARRSTWWRDFENAQLTGLVSLGLVQGLDVQTAVARLQRARALAAAAASTRMPTLGLEAKADTGHGAGKRAVALVGAWQPDLWGGDAARARSYELEADASLYDADTARQLISADIANRYFDILALDERIALASEIASDAQDLLRLVETQARLGAASSLELEQQRHEAQTYAAAVPVLRLRRESAVGELAVLMGIVPQHLSLREDSLLRIPVPAVELVKPADAVLARPEVRAAEARLRAANFDIAVARAAFLPSLGLSAQVGTSIGPTGFAWSLGGSLLQILFDGGQREANLQVARAQAEELVAEYRRAVLRALRDTESQLVAARRLQEAEALGDAAIASAETALKLSRIRYERGASDLLPVILGQRNLRQARDTALQLRLQRLQASVHLKRSLAETPG